MIHFRRNSTKEMSERFLGVMQTIWSDGETFPDGFYGRTKDEKAEENTPWNCFIIMHEKIGKDFWNSLQQVL
jgi:hypothetical protein